MKKLNQQTLPSVYTTLKKNEDLQTNHKYRKLPFKKGILLNLFHKLKTFTIVTRNQSQKSLIQRPLFIIE